MISSVVATNTGVVCCAVSRSNMGLKELVYFEEHEDIRSAIQRSKAIKHWPRAWKVRPIHAQNPDWRDLFETLI